MCLWKKDRGLSSSREPSEITRGHVSSFFFHPLMAWSCVTVVKYPSPQLQPFPLVGAANENLPFTMSLISRRHIPSSVIKDGWKILRFLLSFFEKWFFPAINPPICFWISPCLMTPEGMCIDESSIELPWKRGVHYSSLEGVEDRADAFHLGVEMFPDPWLCRLLMQWKHLILVAYTSQV